ncbi:hypothetical protein MPSEU_000226400 [Mayamaea pseudoterrestris]|nr:hypothetical protein MPSEU_000226400 [Mayamaea pseudoterrestris]
MKVAPGDSSENALDFLAAVAITVLLFGGVTTAFVLRWKHERSRHQEQTLSSSRTTQTMRKLLHETLAVRLFTSGLTALLVLILQHHIWRASYPSDDDNSDEDDYQEGFNFWKLFLYVDGVLVALLIIATSHMVHRNYCSKSNRRDDDTAALSDYDTDNDDKDHQRGDGIDMEVENNLPAECVENEIDDKEEEHHKTTQSVLPNEFDEIRHDVGEHHSDLSNDIKEAQVIDTPIP